MFELLRFVDIDQLKQDIETWVLSLRNPEQFLKPAFDPTKNEFTSGFEFYLKIAGASLCIYAFVALFAGKGSIGVKAKILASGLLGIIVLFIVAMAVHLPFWLLGGSASFLGTCLAYTYAGGPFGPLMAVGQWIMVSSMPTKLRPYALNPTTAGSAAQVALNDPETDKMTFGVGIAVAWVLMAWTTIVTFRCLGFVHDLGGWRFAVAILFSILLTVPISTVTMRMASLLHEQP